MSIDPEAIQLQQSYLELSRRDQVRATSATALRIALSVAVLIAYYVWLPYQRHPHATFFARLVVAIVVILGVLGWQVSKILNAKYPSLRAIEALVVITTLVIVVFASIYYAMSISGRHLFNEPLNRVSAIYFTVATLSTVGYGDISPTAEASQAMVTVQMLFDLILVGAIIRLLFTAAKTGTARQLAKSQTQD